MCIKFDKNDFTNHHCDFYQNKLKKNIVKFWIKITKIYKILFNISTISHIFLYLSVVNELSRITIYKTLLPEFDIFDFMFKKYCFHRHIY